MFSNVLLSLLIVREIFGIFDIYYLLKIYVFVCLYLNRDYYI